MNTKHTPGPWMVDEPEQNGSIIIRDTTNGYAICRVNPTDDAELEDHHNAQLIAAAPALLSALEDCLTFDGATAERSHEMALKRLRAINDIARAAIAQIKGEQP